MERESSTALNVFVLLSAVSLASYVGFSAAVQGFVSRAQMVLAKILELAL